MRKEIKTFSVVCDCCETQLTERNAFLNDGSFQGDYLKMDNIDLCYSCVGKLFDINLKSKVPATKVKEWIKDYNFNYNKSGYNGGNDFTVQLLKTTGINESMPITSDAPSLSVLNSDHNSLEVPVKTTSSLDEVPTLEDL